VSRSQRSESDDVERWLIEVCREFGIPVKESGEDFFGTGASSLTALRLIARVEERYGEDALPPDDLFAESRIWEIAECIRRNCGGAEVS
jgi:acyl carrier protein